MTSVEIEHNGYTFLTIDDPTKNSGIIRHVRNYKTSVILHERAFLKYLNAHYIDQKCYEKYGCKYDRASQPQRGLSYCEILRSRPVSHTGTDVVGYEIFYICHK